MRQHLTIEYVDGHEQRLDILDHVIQDGLLLVSLPSDVLYAFRAKTVVLANVRTFTVETYKEDNLCRTF